MKADQSNKYDITYKSCVGSILTVQNLNKRNVNKNRNAL